MSGFRITVESLLKENKALRDRVLALEQNEKASLVVSDENSALSERLLHVEQNAKVFEVINESNKKLSDKVLVLEQNGKAIKAIHDANKHHLTNYHSFVAIIIAMVAVTLTVISYFGDIYINERIHASVEKSEAEAERLIQQIEAVSTASIEKINAERDQFIQSSKE